MSFFALIGAAGYIAPKHMKAITETNNELVAAMDPFDSVGIIDSYFPNANFFTEIERFDRHLEKLKRGGNQKVDYISICSPNYLHDAHIRLALRLHSHAICEKPLVINPWNLDALEELESKYDKKIYNILQLRYADPIIKLKKEIEGHKQNNKYQVNLKYITRRGKWYDISWKGNPTKSGGILMNIGVHFFDLLLWLFGDVEKSTVDFIQRNKAKGHLELEKASINWFLSVDENDLPCEVRKNNQYAFRTLSIDNNEIEFSDGFTDLHTKVYKDILTGNGVRIKDVRPAIELVYNLRKLNSTNL